MKIPDAERTIVDESVGKQATIRSAWIIEIDSDIPKLTTIFPLIRKY